MPVLFEKLEPRLLLSGAQLVGEIITGPESSVILGDRKQSALGNKFIFVANDETTGQEIWVADGSPTGTKLLKDILPDGSSNPYNLQVGSGAVYFNAFDGTIWQIWKTDGTENGTQAVTAFPNAPATRGSVFIVPSGNLVYYTEQSDSGHQLWVTDGNSPGAPVTAVGGGPIIGAFPTGAADGKLFFVAQSEIGGDSQLWVTDGSPNSAHPLTTSADPGAAQGFFFNGRLYYHAIKEGITGLWASDGTETGTKQIGTTVLTGVRTYCISSGRLYFVADNGGGPQIWSTDGTTLRRDTQVPNNGYNNFFELTDYNGQLYFLYSSPTFTRQLHKLVNGAPVAVTPPTTGGGTSGAYLTHVHGTPNPTGNLFFAAVDANGTATLFESDGQSVSLVANGERDRGINPSGLSNVDGLLLYSADYPDTGHELHSATPTGASALTLDLGPRIIVNQGEKIPVTFDAKLTGGTAQKYAWKFTNTGKFRLFGKNGNAPRFSYARQKVSEIEVICAVRTTDGRTIQASKFIQIANVNPTVTIRASLPTTVPYLPVAFVAEWSDPGLDETFSVVWKFTDGEQVQQYVDTKLHRAKIIKVFTSTDDLADATVYVTDASGGVGFKESRVPVVEASVQSIQRIATLLVGISSALSGGTTASITPSSSPPTQAPAGMRWVNLVIGGESKGDFLIKSLVKIYVSATDVLDVEAATGLVVRVIVSKLP